MAIADGTWMAPLSGPGITTGTVKLVVAGDGRVVQSFSSSFSCESDSVTSAIKFADTPAYDFIRSNGSFYSPLHGNLVHGHDTTWNGSFGAGGGLSGTLRIYDPCTGGVVAAHFLK